MRIFLIGAACVGKTTIGRRLAGRLNVAFFDLDEEVEEFFGISIERLQKKFLTMPTYREEAAKVLLRTLERPDSRDSVIALPPSGLMGGYWRVMKKPQASSLFSVTSRKSYWKGSCFSTSTPSRLTKN